MTKFVFLLKEKSFCKNGFLYLKVIRLGLFKMNKSKVMQFYEKAQTAIK
jgi:hypothetical protein